MICITVTNEKAINVLNNKDKNDFLNYVNHNNSYNPHIMFIAKPEIANNWFIALFEWLSRCEEIFGFDKLKDTIPQDFMPFS